MRVRRHRHDIIDSPRGVALAATIDIPSRVLHIKKRMFDKRSLLASRRGGNVGNAVTDQRRAADEWDRKG